MNLSSFPRLEQHISLRAHVERLLSAAIISGELAPNTLVTVPTLAAQFQVSATPVREAMLDLEKRGFVRSVRNKGFRVTEVSEESLREIVAVRQFLECPAMEQVAGHLPADQIPELRKLADQIVAGAQNGDLKSYLEADQNFHLTLTGLLGNGLLVEVVADLRSRTRLVGLVTMLETRRLDESAVEHHRLLDLLEAGDGPAAADLMRRHIGHTLGWWSGHAEDDAPAT